MPQFQLPGEDTKTLAIVGGGFTGTAALLHTILNAINDPKVDNAHPLRLTLVERHPQQKFGGVAYGQQVGFDHRLNLSSKRITPFKLGKPPEGFPTFDEYLAEKAVEDPSFNNDFANPRRAVYGNYLEKLIDIALEKAGGKVKVDTRYGEVVSFDDNTPGNAVLHFKDGSELPVMHAILATGNKDTARPRFVFNIVSDPNYLDGAYSGGQANSYFERVTHGASNNNQAAALVIGTGLSAMDNAIRLLEGGYKGKVVMMSRHGEMHPVYKSDGVELGGLLKGENRPEKLAEIKKTEPQWLSYVDRASDFNHLMHRMEAEFRQLQRKGFMVEEIMDHWESFNDKVFARFPTETVNYLAANKTGINVMRVGTVPEVMGKLQEYMKTGQLEVMPGDIEDIKPAGGKFVASITPNNGDGQHIAPTRDFQFTHVLNGIGFDNRYDLKPGSMMDPLWRFLEETKGFKSHVTHAGVEVTNDFTMVKGDGTPYNNITMVGVPVAGHLTLTPHNYAEKEGRGTRLGAFTVNIAGTLTSVLEMLGDKYEKFRELQQKPANDAPAVISARRPQPAKAYI